MIYYPTGATGYCDSFNEVPSRSVYLMGQIVKNKSKGGLTEAQADAIITNSAKQGISAEQVAAIEANSAKVGITVNQSEAITTNSAKQGISVEQLAAIETNTAKVGITVHQAEAINTNTAKVERIDTLQSQMEVLTQQLNQLASVIPQLQASIEEKDERIAELEQGGGGQSLEQVLEQVRDAGAGSVVLTVDPEGDNITLGLTIEQSDNLIEWTKLDGEMTRTIPIPDGKKFYRFALDK